MFNEFTSKVETGFDQSPDGPDLNFRLFLHWDIWKEMIFRICFEISTIRSFKKM